METQFHAKNQKKISNGQGCRTGTDERTYGRTYQSEFIGSFRSLKTSGEPTRHIMIGSQERVKIQRSSIPKIKKIHSCVWQLQVKNSQNCQFWPKNGQILATNGQILAISEFSRQIHYDFLKEDHKGSFHIKNYENLQLRLEDIGQKHSKMAILAKNGQILTIFGHFRGQKIFRPKNFLVVI